MHVTHRVSLVYAFDTPKSFSASYFSSATSECCRAGALVARRRYCMLVVLFVLLFLSAESSEALTPSGSIGHSQGAYSHGMFPSQGVSLSQVCTRADQYHLSRGWEKPISPRVPCALRLCTATVSSMYYVHCRLWMAGSRCHHVPSSSKRSFASTPSRRVATHSPCRTNGIPDEVCLRYLHTGTQTQLA